MIKHILHLLSLDEYHGASELIDIAKGKYEIKNTVKGKTEQLKRAKAWRLKKQ